MKRIVVVLLIAAWCLVAATTAEASKLIMPRPIPRDREEGWYDVRLNGERCGTAHDLAETVEYGRRHVHHSVQDTTFTMGGPEGRLRASQCTESWREMDGRLIRLVHRSQFGDTARSIDAEVKGEKVVVTVTEHGRAQTEEVAIPEGVCVYDTCNGRTLRALGFRQGRSFEYTIFSLSSLRLEKETIEHVEAAREVWHGREIDVLRIDQRNSDRPGEVMRMTLTTDFQILRLRFGDFELIRVPRAVPRDPVPLPEPRPMER